MEVVKQKVSFNKNRPKRHLLIRGIGYMIGILLFYAPFAYYNRGMDWILTGTTKAEESVSNFCLHIPMVDFFTGQNLALTVATLSTLIIMVSAFFFGPFFCGFLCPAGALPEYLSRLVPERFKINWTKSVSSTGIRYGMLAGYVFSPLLAGTVVCSFCNYGIFQKILNGAITGTFIALGSTIILTFFIWFFLFGIFAKGGRGYCNFVCPTGAMQNLIHSIGSKLKFTYKLRYDKSKCVSCLSCVKTCPMQSVTSAGNGNGVLLNPNNCLTCRQCVATCPTSALTFGRGDKYHRDLGVQITEELTGQRRSG
ncbi:MAG TPA: 4Fe-4S binding protein [Bacillota bacterium]|nr:4Fe-4S binding protein [Bacillota bacterium]